MLHFIVMRAVVFGLIYAWLFTVSLWLAEWWLGALIAESVGLVHGLLVAGISKCR